MSELPNDDLVDIEEWAKRGEAPPRARRYRIRINRERYVVAVPEMTGRQILELAGKNPENHDLHQIRRGVSEPVALDQIVDFTAPGVERFRAIPTEVQPGAETRRQFRLPPTDGAYLDSLGLVWETIREGGVQWLLLHHYPVETGLSPHSVLLALELPSAYPDVQIDMFYAYPAIRRDDNAQIPATDNRRVVNGQEFQRWSRHRGPTSAWESGEDCVASQLAVVAAEFRREARRAA